MAMEYGQPEYQPDARVHTASDVGSRDVAETLVQARARVATALRRLHAIRLEVLLGTGDAAQYDAVLLDYREAAAALQQAQAAKVGLAARAIPQISPAAAQPPLGPTATEPPAPALRFARWLVEHGRLSEWNVREEGSGSGHAPPARLAFARWLVQTGRLFDWP